MVSNFAALAYEYTCAPACHVLNTKMAASTSTTTRSSNGEVPAQLRQVASHKGIKYTDAQLAAKKTQVELTLKQKCEIVNEAKKQGFQPSNVKTLAYVNQAHLSEVYNVTSKTIKRTLLNAQKLKDRLLTSTGDVKRKRLVKYNVIDKKVVAFVNLLRNRTKPLSVTLSIVREYASSGW